MAFSAITQNVTFQHAPLDAGNNKVAIHFPQTFDAAKPFLLCIFIHGLGLPEDHIQKAIRQMAASTTNVILVAPRFDGNKPGTFCSADGFTSFVVELKSVLLRILKEAGMPEAVAGAIGGFASTTAPIVLVGFSGGWKPVGAILQGLLKRGDGSERVIGIQLLDAVYEDWFCRYAFVEKWIGAKGKQTVLVSIFSSTTDCGAKAGNEHLLRTLRPKEIPKPSSDWSLLPNPLPAGTIAFFEMSTSHPDIPRDGPPTNPIASFLSLLGDRVSAPLLTG